MDWLVVPLVLVMVVVWWWGNRWIDREQQRKNQEQ
jgi:hypothetical protein